MAKIIVPGSSANLGPGFDSLGIALDIFIEAEFFEVDILNYLDIEICGYGKEFIPVDESNLIYKAYKSVFSYLNKSPKGLKVKITNNIPISRGLGSSSTAIVCGIAIANNLLDHVLSEQEVVNLAYKLEGHSDNITAAIVGGFSVSNIVNDEVIYSKLKPISNLKCVVIVPDYELSTKKSRSVIPNTISHKKAVENIGMVSMLLTSVFYDDIELFSKSLTDNLHQPYRKHLVKGFNYIEENYKKYGFLGTTISGSGPTIILYYKSTDNIEFSMFENDLNNLFSCKFDILKLNIIDNGYQEVK